MKSDGTKTIYLPSDTEILKNKKISPNNIRYPGATKKESYFSRKTTLETETKIWGWKWLILFQNENTQGQYTAWISYENSTGPYKNSQKEMNKSDPSEKIRTISKIARLFKTKGPMKTPRLKNQVKPGLPTQNKGWTKTTSPINNKLI